MSLTKSKVTIVPCPLSWQSKATLRQTTYLIGGLAVNLCLSLLAVGETLAATLTNSYTFTKIADNSSLFFDVGGGPLNDSGVVAFVGVLNNGDELLLTSSGDTTTTLLINPRFSESYFGFNGLAINNSGTVAFGASSIGISMTDAIFTTSGGPLNTIIQTSNYIGFPSPFSLNDSGTVVFGTFSAIFTGSGGSLTTIADTNSSIRHFDQLARAINNSGTVAFPATLDDGNEGVFTSKDGVITTIADTSGSLSGGFNNVGINNSDTVIFEASLDNGLEGLFTSNSGLITTIADTGGSFSRFLNNPAINDSGEVAFGAYLDGLPQNGFGHGIFTGSDPLADKVITVGDSLFGSTVTNLFFGNLNNSGQISFLADLTDSNGRTTRFVLRADPVPQSVPEPSSELGLLGVSVFSAVYMRQRWKQRMT